MGYRKLGRAADQRKAMLRGLVTALLQNGRIVTTETRAKEVQSIAEKLIGIAVREADNFESRQALPRLTQRGNLSLLPRRPETENSTPLKSAKAKRSFAE